MPLYNFTLHNVSNLNIDTPLRVTNESESYL